MDQNMTAIGSPSDGSSLIRTNNTPRLAPARTARRCKHAGGFGRPHNSQFKFSADIRRTTVQFFGIPSFCVRMRTAVGHLRSGGGKSGLRGQAPELGASACLVNKRYEFCPWGVSVGRLLSITLEVKKSRRTVRLWAVGDGLGRVAGGQVLMLGFREFDLQESPLLDSEREASPVLARRAEFSEAQHWEGLNC